MPTIQQFRHWCRQLATALGQAELGVWAAVAADASRQTPSSQRQRAPSSH